MFTTFDADAMFRRPLPAVFWRVLQHDGLVAPHVPVPPALA